MTVVDASATDLPSTPPVAVCRLDAVDVERGVAALVDGRQVALFRLADDTVHALDNLDPATGANVVARGLLGTAVDADGASDWYVASPLHKHRYRLSDGHCLSDGRLSLSVHRVQVVDGVIMVTIGARSSS